MPQTRPPFRDAIPALLVCVAATALWLALRTAGPLKPEVFFGWLCLLLVAATVAAIAQAAFATGGAAVLRGFLVLCTATLMLVAAAALAGRYLGILETLRVATIFLLWLCFCSAMAWVLRGLGPATANAISLTIATLLIASPVIAIPLVRAAGSTWQSRFVELIRNTCPFLAVVDAVRPAMKIDWTHLPRMYEWSGLGQDIPMLLPNAWVSVGIYAVVSCGLIAGNLLVKKVRSTENA